MARRYMMVFLLVVFLGASAHAEGIMTPGDGVAVQDVAGAVSFFQEFDVALRYAEVDGVYEAEALPAPIAVPIYATNTSGAVVGPFSVYASAVEVTDAGGCFTLTCALEGAALTLEPGQTARVATFTFTCAGGVSACAEPGSLRLDLWAE